LSSIKLVNYIRQQAKEGNTKLEIKSATEFEDEKYLQPILEDDALLFSLDDLSSSSHPGDASGDNANATTNTSPEAKIAELEKQLQVVQSQYVEYRHQVEETLEKRWSDESTGKSLSSVETRSGKPDYDGNYFDSYSYNGIFVTTVG
jgi:protein arginine N-methyltransferase 3